RPRADHGRGLDRRRPAAARAGCVGMNMVDMTHFHGLRGTLLLDAPLAKHTTWRAGGGADIVYPPADRDDLAAFLRQLPIFEQVTALGLGSNTLVRDGGVHGAVILMHNPGGALAVADGLVYAEAGVACPKLARFAALHGCGGAEFLAGIPGTIGGALAMNAGCYGEGNRGRGGRGGGVEGGGRVVRRPGHGDRGRPPPGRARR